MEPFEILRVDLSTGDLRRERIGAALLAKYVGGKGLGAHYLATELPPGADPLGPANVLVFMTGPVSGIFPGTCRHALITKSPATGGFLDSYAGGYWAWELRKAGLLGIIVKGKAENLVYLEVTEKGEWLHLAGDLKGKSISEVDDDPRFRDHRVCAIGPAGENRVLMACVGNNTGTSKFGRSGFNGRGGAGAVMGAKNLKAVAVRGTRRRIPESAKDLRKTLSAKISSPDTSPSWLAAAGTSVIVDWTNGVNVLPTRNWSAGSFEGAVSIGPEALIRHSLGREGCYDCPLRCSRRLRAPEGVGAFPGAETSRLEYETIGLGASNTGNADFSSIVKFSSLCDELGLDTISTGAAVAFAMACAERGLVNDPIRFGDSQGQARLTEDIAYRRGLGAVLADGVRSAAQAWGVDEGSVPVFEIKGLEFPAYDPRGSVAMALAYATSDRGACHMRAWPIAAEALSSDPQADSFGPVGKAQIVIQEQDEKSAEWCLVGCSFLNYKADDAVAMLNAVGLRLTVEDYQLLGKRVWNLIRLLNLREGWTAADDRIPVALEKPLLDSGRSLQPQVFADMKADYYRLRGWDEQGRPGEELVASLGLSGYDLSSSAAAAADL